MLIMLIMRKSAQTRILIRLGSIMDEKRSLCSLRENRPDPHSNQVVFLVNEKTEV